MKYLFVYILIAVLGLWACDKTEQMPPNFNDLAPATPVLKKNKTEYSYISGLKHIYVLSHPQVNKKVYFLGEEHRRKGICPSDVLSISASDFVLQIPDSTKKFVDIFLEATPFHYEENTEKIFPEAYGAKVKFGENVSFLMDTIEALKPCFTPPHRCVHPNMRVHWTDLRFFAQSIVLKPRIEESFSNWLRELAPRGLVDPAPITVDPAIRLFFSGETAFEFCEKKFLREGKIQKQWKGLPHELIELRNSFFAHYVNDGLSEIREKFEKEEHIVLNSSDFLQLTMDIGIPLAPLVDVYTLGRFLRGFARDGFKPSSSDNAVMYFGAKHSERMVEFLLKIGFEIEQKFEKTLEQRSTHYPLCLEVAELREPLF